MTLWKLCVNILSMIKSCESDDTTQKVKTNAVITNPDSIGVFVSF